MRFTAMPVASLVAVLLSSTLVLLADGQATIALNSRLVGFADTYQLSAEDFWRETLVFQLSIPDGSPSVFSTVASAYADVASIVQGTGITGGIEDAKSSIFSVTPVNSSVINITAAPSTRMLFASPTSDTVQFNFNTQMQPNAAAATTPTSIAGLTTPSSASFEYVASASAGPGLTEALIRQGLVINVEVMFNQFVSVNNTAVTFTSPDASLQAEMGNWVASSTDGAPTTSLAFTLPAVPTFNISESTSITATLHSTSLSVSGLPVSPNTATFTVTSIDLVPIAFCVVANDTVSEDELRRAAGNGVLRTISLSPAGSDAFVTTPQAQMLALVEASITVGRDEVNVSAVSITASEIVLNITADDGASYDTDSSFPVTIVVNPRVLVSAEAGCGRTFLSIVPGPGIVTGVNITDSVTELHVNDELIQMNVTVASDEFLPSATVEAVAVLSPSSATASGAEYFGYVATIADTATVTLSSDRRAATIEIPRAPRYNIPFGSVETIRMEFPGAAMKSGVKPLVQNTMFNVTAVQPTFNVTFNGNISKGRITADSLWAYGANMTLVLRGDTWNVNGRNLWNVNHPRLEGSITRGAELYAAQQSIDRMGGLGTVVVYDEVDIRLREATLPLRALPGLSVPYDERVRVSKVDQLILGRPTVAQEVFILQQVSRLDIGFEFLGDAVRDFIPEKDFRRGFTFVVKLTYQVFRVNSTQDYPELFPRVTSLTPYLGGCSATRAELWTYNVSCPAMPDYDIYEDDEILIEVPADFYYEVPPARKARRSIAVRAEPRSPRCELRIEDVSEINERMVRTVPGGLRVSVRVESNAANDVQKFVNGNYPNISNAITTTHQEQSPLKISIDEPASQITTSKLVLIIDQDPSYEIDSVDVVTINLNRFFFDSGEGCNVVNFTIGVLPGRGFGSDIPATTRDSDVRSQNQTFRLTLEGERVTTPEFDLDMFVTYLPGNTPLRADFGNLNANLYGFQEAKLAGYKVRARAITNWTASGANATVFECVLTAIPQLRILQTQNVTFRFPGRVVASGSPPDMVNNTFIVTPTPSRVKFDYVDTVPERNITRGEGGVIRVELEDDFWNTSVASTLLWSRDYISRSRPDGSQVDQDSGGSVLTVFSPTSFTFPKPNVLVITRSPDEEYNAVTMERITIRFTGAMTISGIAPLNETVELFVTPGTPSLIASGTALDAGSRAFITGGLSMELYLENDLFLPNQLTPLDICPFASCVLALSNTFRRLLITFQEVENVVLPSNTTFTILVKSAAVRSNATVNNVTMHVALEPGIATVAFGALPTLLTEDTIARGLLPVLTLSVLGDRFVEDPVRLAQALATGTACFPASDAYGFCRRALAMFTTMNVQFREGRQSLQLFLQPDEQYDIFTSEVVNISVNGAALDSGLSPTGWTTLTVSPVRGTYFFSASRTVIRSAVIQEEDDPNLEVTLTLRNERFVGINPTARVVEGTRSSQAAADQPSGYERRKGIMYHQAVVSADQRTLKLRLRRTASYSATQDESISFVLPQGAVLGPLEPTLGSSLPATVLIQQSGGKVTMASPTVTSVDRVRAEGINITLQSTDTWSPSYVSGLSLQQVMSHIVSASVPSKEPNGFTALKQVMVQRTMQVNDRRLDIVIRPNARYDLNEDEVITLTLSDPRWGTSARPLYPDKFTIVVKAKLSNVNERGYVVLYIPNPVNEGDLQRDIAQFVGVSTDMVVITRSENYDLTMIYRRVGIDFLPAGPSTAGTSASRTPIEAANFLVNSDEDLLQARLNISALYHADTPMAASALDLKLGLRSDNTIVREEEDLTWLWVSIALVIIAVVVGIVYYHTRAKVRMTATRSRDAGTAPMLRQKNRLDAALLMMDDAEDIVLGAGDSPYKRDEEERDGRLSRSPDRREDVSVRVPSVATPARTRSSLAGRTSSLIGGVRGERRQRGLKTPERPAANPDEALAALEQSGGMARPARARVEAGDDVDAQVASASKRKGYFEDNDERVAGPSLAGPRTRDVRIDLDDYVHSRQPAGFLPVDVPPVEFPRVQPSPVSREVVAVYAPGTKAADKFRTRTVTDSRTGAS